MRRSVKRIYVAPQLIGHADRSQASALQDQPLRPLWTAEANPTISGVGFTKNFGSLVAPHLVANISHQPLCQVAVR